MPPLKIEPNYQPHFDAWKTQQTPATTGALLRAIKPSIDRAIHSYVGQDDPVIRGQAKMMVLKALPKYDPAKAGLGTFVQTHLQSLRRASRKHNQIISIPERVQTDSNYLQRAEFDLTEKLGREPSVAELSRETGLPPKRISHVRSFRYPLAEGTVSGIDEEGQETTPYADPVGEDSKSWREIVYIDADPIDQKIMEWSLGMHGVKPIAPGAMALKLGVSAAAVSQRRARLQRLLDQESELNPL